MINKVGSNLILGYKDIFDKEAPENRINFLKGISKLNLLAELSGINSKLKTNLNLYYDTSEKMQLETLKSMIGFNAELSLTLLNKWRKFSKQRDVSSVVIFSRQMCLYASEEILQSDLVDIPNQTMQNDGFWENFLYYILAVNSEITKIKKSDPDESVNFETLSPKMLVLNELSLNADPIATPYRGYHLMKYLDENEIGKWLQDYFDKTYGITYDHFIYEIMSIYFHHGFEKHENWMNFFYRISEESVSMFTELSKHIKNENIQTLLKVRKYPFYKGSELQYILLDNTSIMEKMYSQFINDFYFDYLKNEEGTSLMTMQTYKGIIGNFFQQYVSKIIKHAFSSATPYTIRCLDELLIEVNKQQIEYSDLYIRCKRKIIIGEIKSTTIYDTEKYSGNIDGLYKNNKAKFFKDFGLNQLIKSIADLRKRINLFDQKANPNDAFQIFPLIIVSEKSLQVSTMNILFRDTFEEMLAEINTDNLIVHPLSIIHISDLETIQDFIHDKYYQIWDILRTHVTSVGFPPPFYQTLLNKAIKPKHHRVMELYEELLPKYQNKKV